MSQVQGTLQQVDPEIADLIESEERRQASSIRLIASENYASRAVMNRGSTSLSTRGSP